MRVNRTVSARLAAAMAACLAASATAAERPLEFIEGLRARGYTDTALEAIDLIAADPDTPSEVKTRLPYERGVTLLKEAEGITNRDKQRDTLDRATEALAEFTKTAPKDDPLLPEANTQRGLIWLSRAQVEIFESRAPANEGGEAPFRQRAREYIENARRIFEQARDQFEAAYKKFPTFIPPEEPELQRQQREAEQRYIQAQLNLARTTYERAQTFEEGSDLRKKTLNQAADEFEALYQKYRTYFSGLYARLFQGKSFEEQDEVGKALGIYNEILDHPGSGNAGLVRLQDIARRFRLICLNHPKRRDYQLVIDEGTLWRNGNGNKLRTPVGLGISYELARGHENLADDRNTPDNKKKDHYQQALSLARGIARFPGEFKAPAATMIQRLNTKLNRDGGDPQDFDTAYGFGNVLLDEIKDTRAKLQAAQATGDKKAAGELAESLKAKSQEASRMFRLALELSNPNTDQQQVNFSRYRLAYTYMLEGKYLESAVLGTYIAKKYRREDPQTAVEAAYLALAGLDREYFATPQGQRSFELQQVINVADQIIEDFPNDGYANDARMAVARVYRADARPKDAAEWYGKVPQGVGQYAAAQLDAGQSWWTYYLTEAARPDGERPPADELAAARKNAEQSLQTGIDLTEKGLADATPTPDALALAKLSLAQIRNADGVYKTKGGKTGSVELLTEGPHSVESAVSLGEGEERPNVRGAVKSRPIASLAYQQMLRAYIGLRDLKKAREAREKLEAVAGKDDAAALTQVYVSFGRELQQELSQLKAAGETDRLNDVRAAFEEFLGDLFKRTDGQTYNSLLWIAETYAGLGEGSSDSPAKAQEYFNRSADAYNAILPKIGQPGFLANLDAKQQNAQKVGVKVRLANARRRQGDFEEAEKTMFEVLKELPRALDAQFEAAQLYEAWGDADSAVAAEKYKTALVGVKEPADVWGYARTAKQLQSALSQQPGNEDFRRKHFDARYKSAEVYMKTAKSSEGKEAYEEALNRGKLAISRFAAISNDFPPEEFDRFNKLYQEFQKELGEEPEVLLVGGRPPEADTETGGGDAPAAAPAGVAEEEPAAETGPGVNWLPLLGVGALTLAAIGGFFWMSGAKAKKRRSKYAPSGDAAAGDAIKKPAPAPSFAGVGAVGEGDAGDAPSFDFLSGDAEPAPAFSPDGPPVGDEGGVAVAAAPTKPAAPPARPKSAPPTPPAKSEKAKPKPTPEQIAKAKAARAAKAKAEAAGKPADAAAPVKKKRTLADLSPEEIKILKARKAAKLKAQRAAAEAKKKGG